MDNYQEQNLSEEELTKLIDQAKELSEPFKYFVEEMTKVKEQIFSNWIRQIHHSYTKKPIEEITQEDATSFFLEKGWTVTCTSDYTGENETTIYHNVIDADHNVIESIKIVYKYSDVISLLESEEEGTQGKIRIEIVSSLKNYSIGEVTSEFVI